MCDGLKSAGSWLVDNIKEILVVGLAVLAVVVVVALAIATFGLDCCVGWSCSRTGKPVNN